MCVYIYIYIEREREREIICVYIYIYICIYIYIYVLMSKQLFIRTVVIVVALTLMPVLLVDFAPQKQREFVQRPAGRVSVDVIMCV